MVSEGCGGEVGFVMSCGFCFGSWWWRGREGGSEFADREGE